MCKSRASHRALATCNILCDVSRGTDSSTIKFDRVELAFILALFYWLTINQLRRRGNRSTRRKPLATSFRKCHILKPEDSSPKRDSNPHSSIGGILGKQTLHHASPPCSRAKTYQAWYKEKLQQICILLVQRDKQTETETERQKDRERKVVKKKEERKRVKRTGGCGHISLDCSTAAKGRKHSFLSVSLFLRIISKFPSLPTSTASMALSG